MKVAATATRAIMIITVTTKAIISYSFSAIPQIIGG